MKDHPIWFIVDPVSAGEVRHELSMTEEPVRVVA
jgi:hypothetical protein